MGAGALGLIVVVQTADGGPSAKAVATVPGSITGRGFAAKSGVFRDIDADGVWDAGEPGQGGITVTATCVADDGGTAISYDDVYAPPTTTTTAADGSFTLTGANVRGQCRVEFSIPAAMQSFLQPGVATTAVAAPNSAGSFVQFVTAATPAPTVTTSVNNPAEFTNAASAPRVATIIQHGGDPAQGDSATFDSLVTFNYNGTGLAGQATAQTLGSVWGLAYQRSTGTLFTSAMLKRHSGMGPSGASAIYAVGPNSPWSTPFTGVNVGGLAIQSNAARGLGLANAPSDDNAAFGQVGKVSWGDLDISEDGTTLYAVNLSNNTLQPIDIASKTAGAPLAIPDPSCVGGVARPWGLGVKDGLIYAGVVCDASTSLDPVTAPANLVAFVYAYNPATGTWSANLVNGTAGIRLDYAKGCASNRVAGCEWNPWTDTYTEAAFNTDPNNALTPNAQLITRPQPILSDIAFDDDGSLLLGFSDRIGHQFGYNNVRPDSTDQSTNLQGVVGGDVLRATPTAAGFVLESGGSIARGAALGGGTVVGATNNQGPGGGEVYSFESLILGPAIIHDETSTGSLAKVAGQPDYLMSIITPFKVDSGGIGWFATNGGTRSNAVQLYDSSNSNGTPTGFGKAAGLGDLEIISELAPVEVGNRVWRDDNGNGIQDPAEPSIAGVTVQMVVGTNAPYTAVTDANGQYLFSSVARAGATTAPALAAANYRFAAGDDPVTIRILNATGAAQQAPLVGLVPTEANDAFPNAANVGGSNANDSDGVVTGTSVEVRFTLGSLTGGNDSNATAGDSVDREGFNRHIFDFGFVPRVSLGNRVWFDTNNNSILDPGETPVPGVLVVLFHDANANGVIDATEQGSVAVDTTDANGLYFFDQFTQINGSPLPSPRLLVPGNYIVGIDPSNFAPGRPLAGYLSSGTTISPTGVITDPAVDPNNNVNSDDNGVKQTAGFFAGGVLSLPVTLTPGAEPPAEETGVFNNNDNTRVPDTNSNLTVDFGFYTQSVGNLVWVDNGAGGGNDDNGVVDGAEAGIGGVPVRIYAADGTTEIPVGPDGVLGTADDGPGGVVTSGTGAYQFGGLPQGSFVIKITAPAGYSSSTDPANGATPLTLDSDDNGTGRSGGVISSNPFPLTPGASTNGSVPNNANGTTTNPRVDFGLVQAYDLTIAKTLTSSGPFVAGVPVTFSLVVTNLGPGTAQDGLTVTDRLPAGLSYAAPAATGGPQWSCAAPVGQDVTCTWNGPTPGLGNDVLAAATSLPPVTINAKMDSPTPAGPLVNRSVVEPSPNQSAPETNPVGATPDKFEDGNPATGSNNDDSKSITPTVLFAVGDYVWHDSDHDGFQDPSESPVRGVTVTLLNPDLTPARDASGNVVPPAVTDALGHYVFDNLPAGDYVVRFTTLPAGYVFTTQGAGGGADSNPVATSGVTPVFSVTPSSSDVRQVFPGDSVTIATIINPTIDAGIWNPAVDVASSPPVVRTPPPPAGSLPATGAQGIYNLVLAALLALLGGLAMVYTGRYRRKA